MLKGHSLSQPDIFHTIPEIVSVGGYLVQSGGGVLDTVHRLQCAGLSLLHL